MKVQDTNSDMLNATLLFEVVTFWECVCVEDFKQYCAKAISGKMKYAGYFSGSVLERPRPR
jgi:hypothetical protein